MEVDMTALEKKWAQEKAEKQPSLDDAYRSDGSLDVNSITEDVKSHIPRPTGWRLVVLPYRGAQKTKGGILLADQTIERQQVTTVCAYVLSVGDLAYKDEAKFPTGAWCKEGDWVVFGRYAGARISIDGGEIRILNDDEILARINDPEDILHM
jgi:co-chaperonin GroES (HSP10)